MWCTHCRLDVPSAAALDEPHRVLCPHCRAPLAGTAGPGSDDEAAAGEEMPGEELEPLLTEAWEADLHAIEELLSDLDLDGRASALSPPAATEPTIAPALPRTGRSPAHAAAMTCDARSGSPWISWLVMSVGLMLLSCGGVLMGWAYWASRPELWPVGVPLALLGSGGLLTGLILQIEALWQAHRVAVHSVRDMDEQLAQLQQLATLLAGVQQRQPGQTLYVHPPERANPQLLLAELKGQIEMLALSLAANSSR